MWKWRPCAWQRALPPGHSARAGGWAGGGPCEGSLSRSLTPTRRAAKLLQPLIAVIGSPRTSRRRVRAICTLLFTHAFSGAARGLRRSGAAPRVARSTRRAAGGPPVPLGRASSARGASACTHSSSDPQLPARDRRLVVTLYLMPCNSRAHRGRRCISVALAAPALGLEHSICSALPPRPRQEGASGRSGARRSAASLARRHERQGGRA